jgi:hypothetical protein
MKLGIIHYAFRSILYSFFPGSENNLIDGLYNKDLIIKEHFFFYSQTILYDIYSLGKTRQ